uniref:Ig-like domain-containing protein n=1 Tax=Anopheles dirus TaxID=7168 RepID=A0A182N9S2_9DIPT
MGRMPSVASTGLRNLSLSIKPPWVRRGQEAQLHCQYEMEGAPLYSVKWYRGTLEFYRYSPFENPPAKIFPFTGIKVDRKSSISAPRSAPGKSSPIVGDVLTVMVTGLPTQEQLEEDTTGLPNTQWQ